MYIVEGIRLELFMSPTKRTHGLGSKTRAYFPAEVLLACATTRYAAPPDEVEPSCAAELSTYAGLPRAGPSKACLHS